VRRRLLATLAFAACAALLASAATSPQAGLAVPSGAGVRGKEPGPLLGTVWNDVRGQTELVHVDPDSLRPLPAPSLRIGQNGTTWAYSPTRDRLAIATHVEGRRGISASFQVVDPLTLRRSLVLPLGSSQVLAMAWLEPDRVVALRFGYHPERLEVVTIAPSAKRVIASTKLHGEVHGVARTPSALVLLLSPEGRIGAATLAVVSANGEVRTVTLDRIWIGFERSDGDSGEFAGTQRGAGFTVDPEGGRALVFPAGSAAAAIDLGSLAVTYHTPHEPVSLFGRLRRFLDPTATAKLIDGPSRTARWLGDGLVAITGADYATWRDGDSRFQTRATPAGLMVVDTSSWQIRTIDRSANWVVYADGVLLATGEAWDSSTTVRTSMGLAAYSADGSRRFRLFPGEQVSVWRAFRGRAYVGKDKEPFRIVDLASGQVVGTRREAPPWLLVDDALLFG
jgi:hypothetical protein